jgi:aldehyde:ferredoxin oxidoreductase
LFSYAGHILRVNLSTGAIQRERLNREWAERYYGGKGLGMKYLFEELAPQTDPLSPDNKLILMTGPLTGTIVPCSGKLDIITKSPATGTILACSIGGYFAGELKFAGYDAVVIEGKAEKPVYLSIKDSRAEIFYAHELWGKGTFETESLLREGANQESQVLCIGPAGENLLPMACINSEHYRQAGRGGVGAVMGSKNLKAIVARGTGEVAVADSKNLMQVAKDLLMSDALSDTNLWAFIDGTPMLVDLSQSAAILPTRNFQSGTFEHHERINSETLKKHRQGKKACLSCALGCGNFTRIGEHIVEGPEYETLAIGGANCGISDMEAIVKFNTLCDDLGLDTISTGGTIAFAMELTEKGIHDFGVHFGDIAGYLKLTEQMGCNEGIGKELAQGVRYLAQRYGGADFAMEVKGLEFPGYEPRGSWGMGLAYATSDRGACHLRAWPVANEAFGNLNPFTIEGKARLVINGQHYNAAKFSAILCDFWAISLDNLAMLLSAALGRPVTGHDLELAGERIYNLSRLFNVREGFTRQCDTLPRRIFQEALSTGVTTGKLIPQQKFEQMLSEYYILRGWDSEGRPTQETIARLVL